MRGRAIVEQPSPTVTVLSSLLAAQDEVGYLPYEAVDEVSLRTGASVNEVWAVASFYPNFRFTPPARHSVEICWGPTCHVLGAQPILQGLVSHLGLDGERRHGGREHIAEVQHVPGRLPRTPRR